MKTIEECLKFLADNYGERHDVRIVPSVILGSTDFYMRVTVSNLPTIHTQSSKSYDAVTAFNHVIERIKITDTQTEFKEI